jgi:DNA-binding MarR family transcriptional regulator
MTKWMQYRIDRIIHEPARLLIMAHLFVVESADFLFLQRHTGLTWGNISSHMHKLEKAGYVAVKKELIDKKPHTTLHLANKGRKASQEYRNNIYSKTATITGLTISSSATHLEY